MSLWLGIIIGVFPCFGEEHPRLLSLISTDPLTRQIWRRQLTQKNGGVTAVVRIATGQSIELKALDTSQQPLSSPKDSFVFDPGAIPGLAPLPALLPSTQSIPKKQAPVKKASAQAKILENQGVRQNWGEGVKEEDQNLTWSEYLRVLPKSPKGTHAKSKPKL